MNAENGENTGNGQQEGEEREEREPEEVPFDETTEALRLQLAELTEQVRLHLEGR